MVYADEEDFQKRLQDAIRRAQGKSKDTLAQEVARHELEQQVLEAQMRKTDAPVTQREGVPKQEQFSSYPPDDPRSGGIPTDLTQLPQIGSRWQQPRYPDSHQLQAQGPAVSRWGGQFAPQQQAAQGPSQNVPLPPSPVGESEAPSQDVPENDQDAPPPGGPGFDTKSYAAMMAAMDARKAPSQAQGPSQDVALPPGISPQQNAGELAAKYTPPSPDSPTDQRPEDRDYMSGETDAQYRKRRAEQVRYDFTKQFGRPPSGVRFTADGEALPTVSPEDYQSMTNWLKLRREAAQTKHAEMAVSGEDPVAERQFALQEKAQRFAATQQDKRTQAAMTMEQQRAEDARLRDEAKTAEKEKADLAKQKATYDADMLTVLNRANDPNATPEQRAFAEYHDSVSRGLPGSGLPLGLLDLARKGATQLTNMFSGTDQNAAAGMGTHFSDTARRNMVEFLNNTAGGIAKDYLEAHDKGTQVTGAQTAGVPAPPNTLPLPPNTYSGELRDIGARMMENPLGAQEQGVGVSGLGKLSRFLANPLPSSLSTPEYRPTDAGLLPTTPAAAQRLQQILSKDDNLGRAVTHLMFGLGTENQRRQLLDYVTKYGGLSQSDVVLRLTMNDPKWNDIVNRDVLGTFRQYAQARPR